jgi:hypothetical protein
MNYMHNKSINSPLCGLDLRYRCRHLLQRYVS